MPTYTTNYNLAKPLVNDPQDEDLWGGYLNSDMDTIDTTMKAISDAVSAAVPTGSVFPYTGTAAPTNFLLCYGQAISRATYAALFAVTGTVYGIGDGSTTFNVPDLRGRAVAGQDDMGGVSADRLTGLSGGVDGDVLGAAGGEQAHVLTTGELAAHTHIAAGYSGGAGSAGTASGYFLTSSAGPAPSPTYETNPLTGSTGSDTAHNTVQPTLILNYIIKAT